MKMEKDSYQSVVLIILGGLGVRLNGEDNAFSSAKMPYFRELLANYPAAVLSVSGNSRKSRYEALGGTPPFSSLVSMSGLNQLFIAETERAAFLLESLRGKREFGPGESAIIVPSLVGDYPDKPLGKIKEIEAAAVKAIKKGGEELLIVDISAIDLMMEFGDLKKIGRTIARVDEALRKICEAEIEKGGAAVITSYGGNAERLRDLSLDRDDRNLTDNPVPLLIVAKSLYGRSLSVQDIQDGDLSTLSPLGSLTDVGPTIFGLFGLDTPADMLGLSLIAN
jgi:2,3-bisphosphoglycerate-independent phosphoglycerate mutase